MEFKHTHSSGRYDAAADRLNNAARSYSKTSSLLTFTEVSSEARERALQLPGFKVLATDHGLKDDSAIVFDTSIWELVEHHPVLVGRHRFKIGRHLSSPLWAQVAVLEHKVAKKRIVVGVCHFPSSVEGDLAHKRRTDRVLAWNQATGQLRKHVNKMKRKYKAKGAILSADWNINFKHRWARAFVKAKFPLWTLVWSKTLPARGTHGARLIDAAVLKGLRVLKAFVEPDDNSSDHVPWSEVIQIG